MKVIEQLVNYFTTPERIAEFDIQPEEIARWEAMLVQTGCKPASDYDDFGYDDWEPEWDIYTEDNRQSPELTIEDKYPTEDFLPRVNVKYNTPKAKNRKNSREKKIEKKVEKLIEKSKLWSWYHNRNEIRIGKHDIEFITTHKSIYFDGVYLVFKRNKTMFQNLRRILFHILNGE